MRQFVYSKVQYKSGLPTVNVGSLGCHSLYIKKMDAPCVRQKYEIRKQVFTSDEILRKYLKEGDVQQVKNIL